MVYPKSGVSSILRLAKSIGGSLQRDRRVFAKRSAGVGSLIGGDGGDASLCRSCHHSAVTVSSPFFAATQGCVAPIALFHRDIASAETLNNAITTMLIAEKIGSPEQIDGKIVYSLRNT